MKKIEGYENYAITKDGQVINLNTGKARSLDLNKSVGYFQIDLYKNNQRTKAYVHRLVALAYIPNPNDLLEVNHKDSNRLNNSVDNLEWVSSSGNSKHAVNAGRQDHVARMSNKEIAYAFSLVLLGDSYVKAASKIPNSNSPGLLSVKVAKYAKEVGQYDQLKEALHKQRNIRAINNLEKANK